MRTFATQVRNEFRRLLSDAAVVITIIGGALFYAALYPQPYLNNQPRDVEVAVVDHDRTATSRQLTRWVDATPEVAVVRSAASIDAARTLLQNREIHGFFIIQRGFSAAVTKRKSPVLAIAGDANYFLLDSNVIEGVAAAAQELGARVRTERLILSGLSPALAERSHSPLRLQQVALFNSSMGYLSYVIPAVFVLILHQTLLLAAGLLGAGRGTSAEGASALLELAARFVVLSLVYLPLTYLYFDLGFAVYDIETTASKNDLLMLIVAFVAATVSAGLAFGAMLPRRELAAPVVMASSLPLVFSAGFVWPLEMIPQPIVQLSHFVPSTSAIQGFLKLNQMGAELGDVLDHWLLLMLLAIVYFGIAVVVLSRRRRPSQTPDVAVERAPVGVQGRS